MSNKIIDFRLKKSIIEENIRLCKYDQLSQLKSNMTIKKKFNNNYDLPEPDDFCEVHVLTKHPLLLTKSLINNNYRPLLLTTVTNEFDGTNIETSKGMHDNILNIRTNFLTTINQTFYPIKGIEVVYNPTVTIIRELDTQFSLLPMQEMYSIGVCVASPLHNPKIVKNLLGFDDYIITKELIETVFQTAIDGHHDVVILPDFGCLQSGGYIEAITDIYNACILKYGHMFRYIFIAFEPDVYRSDKDKKIYNYMTKNIIYPQEY
jgi:hypothetical protein